MTLSKKIDFALIIEVNRANPNGDPLNGNRPRTDFGGFGEITDVCLKRKLRDRLQEYFKAQGNPNAIFVQSDERKYDGMKSLKDRAEAPSPIGLGKEAWARTTTKDKTRQMACQKWFDVRSFGQVFAFGKGKDVDGVSIPVRGPVTIQSAFSVEPVTVSSNQITKSVSGEDEKGKNARMGMKHRIDKGIYVTFGAITPQLAERTGFSDADAEIIKSLLPNLFEGDASSARPEGSMRVLRWFWWEQDGKTPKFSSAKVHESLAVNADGTHTLLDIGLKPIHDDEGF